MKFFALAALASCAAFVAAIPASPEDSALAARNFEVAAADTSAVSLDSEDFDLDVEAADDDDEVEDDTPALDSRAAAKCSSAPNTATLNLIKEFEGFVNRPLPDPIGLPTVGFGHLCQKKGCAETKLKFPITKAQGTTLLKKDVTKFVNCLKGALKKSVKLNANQFGALVSWSFNVGCGNMKSSTLLKKLNRGDNPNTAAAKELPRWNKAGGKTLAGLTRRRKAEVALFKKANTVVAHPC